MHLHEANETCRRCGGQKVVEIPMSIGRICPQCNGKGHVDWVSYAMDSKRAYESPNEQLLYRIVMRNIQTLRQEIIDQGTQLGLVVDVALIMKDERQFEREYMLKPSPMLLPPGVNVL